MWLRSVKKQRCRFSYLLAALALITVVSLYAIRDRQMPVQVALEPVQSAQLNAKAESVAAVLKPQKMLD